MAGAQQPQTQEQPSLPSCPCCASQETGNPTSDEHDSSTAGVTWTFGSQAGGTVSCEECGPRVLYSCLYAPCVRQEVL